MKNTLKEFKSLNRKPAPAIEKLIEEYFIEQRLIVELIPPPGEKAKIPKSKLLILVDHATDENKWWVNTYLLPNLTFLVAMTDGVRMLRYKGSLYIGLPAFEQLTGERFDNFRECIAKHLAMLTDELSK